jgi:hypothetical protein
MFFSDIELARRVEEANAITNAKYAEAHAQLYPDSDASVLAIGGGQAIYMGPTSPLTQVLGFGLHNSITLSEIEEIENFYFSKNTPVNIELCPLVETCLLENLANRNYKLIEVSNVLVKQLGKNILPISAIPNIKIEKISQNKAKIWVNVMSKGFSEFPEAAGMLENMWLTGFEVPNNHYFLASTNADEIPAGAASISIYNGVASLCGASTLPEFRKLGIQTTLLQHRFNLAIEQNCDLATISTLPGTISQRNAERQGFQVIYTRVKLMRSKS